jgi:hypothetical protein
MASDMSRAIAGSGLQIRRPTGRNCAIRLHRPVRVLVLFASRYASDYLPFADVSPVPPVP